MSSSFEFWVGHSDARCIHAVKYRVLHHPPTAQVLDHVDAASGTYRLPASDEPADFAAQDLVFIALKAHAIGAMLPRLRRFARTLARNQADADDLVQETLTKAWAHRARFEPGSNLRAWLFTILRKCCMGLLFQSTLKKSSLPTFFP